MMNTLARPFRLKVRKYKKELTQRMEKWRWLILASIGLSLLWVEVQEFLALRVLNQAFHYFEVFQYAVLLVSTGLLLELFARSDKAHKQALKILEYKHALSLDLTLSEDWKSLTAKLAELPGRIAEVEESFLLVSNLRVNKFEIVSHWREENMLPSMAWDPTVLCDFCMGEVSNKKGGVHQVYSRGIPSPDIYCLGIVNANLPVTFFRFKLRDDAELTSDQAKIFNNIGNDVAVALRASQDRKRLSELQLAETAMAERRTVSAYVHDQLGQNLGYLHLKLDQLSADKSASRLDKLRTELGRLRDVANESYEIVRDILKRMQPETTPHLTNILREHARTVSQRAKFKLEFNCTGKPVPLSSDVQQVVFYTFREILNNVEKHAEASKIDVLITWSEAYLDISVADNGIGFDPKRVRKDEHFGLSIMQERLASLNGQVMINSSSETGTNVSISMPLKSMDLVRS